MKKIVHIRWFSPSGQANISPFGIIGAVAVEYERYWQAYIGCVLPTNVTDDALKIADYGAKLVEEEAMGMFPQMKGFSKAYKGSEA